MLATVLAAASAVVFLLAAFGVVWDAADLTLLALCLWASAFAASWAPSGWSARNRG